MRNFYARSLALIALLASALLLAQDAGQIGIERWTASDAGAWYARQPWLVGSNYIPSYASNELEMWQADTFNPKRIDTELGWAQGLGMTTMRVFLHDLLWQQDSEGFKKRIDTFLRICDKHKIKPVFVLFDSVWDPNPHLGKQPPPQPGIHNSRWLQSPGAAALQDPSQYPRLETYVKGVVGAFGHDQRVLGWDVWNEPDNTNNPSYNKFEPKNKVQLVLALLPQAFTWARSTHPQQPLTSGVWHGDWSDPAKLEPMAKEQLELSDITSFHNYSAPANFETHVKWLQQYGRPIICTEYMARPENSTFEGILPLAKQFNVGAINWGFVQGKTQTYLPWDSWQHPYIDHPPAMWFHDIFYPNGKPYRPAEVAFIKKMTSQK
ncbi:MAG: cellulase family glycosylhydrolase [Acidobacteriaceae bacterium]|nr:cellulase family glycosylhydrolase [Acidobacteriaceae bacterium]